VIECYGLAGAIGVSPSGLTLRELRWMADAAGRAWRERLVSVCMLAAGKIANVARYIETGDVGDAPASTVPLTSEVARHAKAIELNGGRFVMPEDVERILSQHGATPTETA